MNINHNSDGTHTTVTLSGALTLEHARQIHEALVAALREHTSIAVKADDVQALDLSFLQLICSAHRSALPLGKSLSLAFKDEACLQQVLGQAGFQHHRGCCLNPDKSCIWQGEGPS